LNRRSAAIPTSLVVKLLLQAFAGLAFLIAVLAAALFVSAGTFDYWQAWAFLAVFMLAVTIVTVDLARRDRALLARRVKAGPVAEPTLREKVLQSLASPAFIAIFVVSGLDRREHWSHVPLLGVLAGDVLVALGLFVVFRVFRANTFTAAVIEVAADQQVVSTGPYAVVRHPMYAGAFLMLLGVPPALGSIWAFFALPPLVAVIVTRLIHEEALLSTELRGYPEYRARVRYRLLPFIW
jgi:protein-S-isoprenylcysteine O-methyltransferase Ste14